MNEIEIINKLENNEELTSQEVEFLISEYEYEEETEYSENRRRSRYANSIIKVNINNNIKFFMLEWENGLTPYQENKYFSQIAKEVKLVEKQITIKTWEIINE